MAPKKKNTQDSINARLALVMKSGKGALKPTSLFGHAVAYTK